MTKEDIELTSFQIIAHAGDALDCFQKAIDSAKENKFELSDEFMRKGKGFMTEAHKIQTKLLTLEANNEDIDFSVILLHSQDHLMTTLNYERMANEFIDLYKRLNTLEKQGG